MRPRGVDRDGARKNRREAQNFSERGDGGIVVWVARRMRADGTVRPAGGRAWLPKRARHGCACGCQQGSADRFLRARAHPRLEIGIETSLTLTRSRTHVHASRSQSNQAHDWSMMMIRSKWGGVKRCMLKDMNDPFFFFFDQKKKRNGSLMVKERERERLELEVRDYHSIVLRLDSRLKACLMSIRSARDRRRSKTK